MHGLALVPHGHAKARTVCLAQSGSLLQLSRHRLRLARPCARAVVHRRSKTRAFHVENLMGWLVAGSRAADAAAASVAGVAAQTSPLASCLQVPLNCILTPVGVALTQMHKFADTLFHTSAALTTGTVLLVVGLVLLELRFIRRIQRNQEKAAKMAAKLRAQQAARQGQTDTGVASRPAKPPSSRAAAAAGERAAATPPPPPEAAPSLAAPTPPSPKTLRASAAVAAAPVDVRVADASAVAKELDKIQAVVYTASYSTTRLCWLAAIAVLMYYFTLYLLSPTALSPA